MRWIAMQQTEHAEHVALAKIGQHQRAGSRVAARAQKAVPHQVEITRGFADAKQHRARRYQYQLGAAEQLFECGFRQRAESARLPRIAEQGAPRVQRLQRVPEIRAQVHQCQDRDFGRLEYDSSVRAR